MAEQAGNWAPPGRGKKDLTLHVLQWMSQTHLHSWVGYQVRRSLLLWNEERPEFGALSKIELVYEYMAVGDAQDSVEFGGMQGDRKSAEEGFRTGVIKWTDVKA
ncbi:hypothetical protein CVT26_008406 [Gymnopilus dilepis]|uniref:Uncharacterized protein n=1 Tax=Gymnopilus dilepis TaxID=231916 RepID=A0A409WNV4_9AGAR|nr:hypothetical protein CVT26_008406 [Gymnopilus dilepis]